MDITERAKGMSHEVLVEVVYLTTSPMLTKLPIPIN